MTVHASESILSNEQLEAIREWDACTISNVIETFGIRLANQGFADASVRCIYPGRRAMLGYAVTGRILASGVPITGHHFGDRTGWWNYILAEPAPRVVVIEDLSDRPGLGAFVGEVHSNILVSLGCVGVVTNGAVRDLPAVEALDFALFAHNVAVSHCYAHLVDFGRPVQIGGLGVHPGDLIFGDCHGVLSIPAEIAPEIPAAAARLRAQEQQIIQLCRSRNFSIEKLRSLISSQ